LQHVFHDLPTGEAVLDAAPLPSGPSAHALVGADASLISAETERTLANVRRLSSEGFNDLSPGRLAHGNECHTTAASPVIGEGGSDPTIPSEELLEVLEVALAPTGMTPGYRAVTTP
jgi:hypothetical protein